MNSLARARRGDCIVYTQDGRWCAKAAGHVHSDDPDVARHWFGEVAK